MLRNIAYVPQNVTGNNISVFDAVLLGESSIKWDVSNKDLEINEDFKVDAFEEYALRNANELSVENCKSYHCQSTGSGTKILLLDELANNLDENQMK